MLKEFYNSTKNLATNCCRGLQRLIDYKSVLKGTIIVKTNLEDEGVVFSKKICKKSV